MRDIAINTLSVTPRSGGVKTYLTSLVRALLELGDGRSFRLLCSPLNEPVFAFARDYPNARIELLPLRSLRAPLRIFYDQVVVPRRLRATPDTVLITPSSVGSIFVRNPQVTIVQAPLSVRAIRLQSDAARHTISRAQSLYFDVMMPLSIRASTAVVAVSHHLAEGLEAQFGRPVTVVHEGVDLNAFDGAAPPLRDAGEAPYLLFVSTLFPYKNAAATLAAFARLRAERRVPEDLRLRIAGKDPNGRERAPLEALAQRLGVATHTDFLGLVPHEQVPALYANAAVFVYPSEMETFGLPLLEAMRMGVPVVASNRMSVPEVVGDAGIIFDPDDIGGMCDAIDRALRDDATRRRLVEAGRRRSLEFRWHDAAVALLRTVDALPGAMPAANHVHDTRVPAAPGRAAP